MPTGGADILAGIGAFGAADVAVPATTAALFGEGAATAGGIGGFLGAGAGAADLIGAGAGAAIGAGTLGSEGGAVDQAVSAFPDTGVPTGPGAPGTSETITPEGGAPAAGGIEGAGSGLSDIFKQVAPLFKQGGVGMGAMQILSSFYGLDQSKKLQRQVQGADKAGEQAVMRSMASQGYQGSGNMMAALAKLGSADAIAQSQASLGPLVGQLSSLGLLTSGLPMLAGWGGGAPAAPSAPVPPGG